VAVSRAALSSTILGGRATIRASGQAWSINLLLTRAIRPTRQQRVRILFAAPAHGGRSRSWFDDGRSRHSVPTRLDRVFERFYTDRPASGALAKKLRSGLSIFPTQNSSRAPLAGAHSGPRKTAPALSGRRREGPTVVGARFVVRLPAPAPMKRARGPRGIHASASAGGWGPGAVRIGGHSGLRQVAAGLRSPIAGRLRPASPGHLGGATDRCPFSHRGGTKLCGSGLSRNGRT